MLTIIVTPHPTTNDRKHANLFDATLEGETKILCTSKQPFLDGARKLLARGHDPKPMLVMQWAGAKDWALRGWLGVAAKLTVDEHYGTFAEWKPLSRSTVPPKIAKFADHAPEDPAAGKTTRSGTAEKQQRLAPTDSEQVGRGSPKCDEFRPEPTVRAMNVRRIDK